MHVNSFYPHGVKLSENSPGRRKKTSEKKKKKKSFSGEFLVFLQNKHFISAFFLTLCFFFHLLSQKEKELKKIILANVFLFFFKKNLLNFFSTWFHTGKCFNYFLFYPSQLNIHDISPSSCFFTVGKQNEGIKIILAKQFSSQGEHFFVRLISIPQKNTLKNAFNNYVYPSWQDIASDKCRFFCPSQLKTHTCANTFFNFSSSVFLCLFSQSEKKELRNFVKLSRQLFLWSTFKMFFLLFFSFLSHK